MDYSKLIDGWNNEMVGVAGAWAALAHLVLWPLVRIRRRTLTDKDEPSGAYYVPRSLHVTAILIAASFLGVAWAFVSSEAPIHCITAAWNGCMVAVAAHEVRSKRQRSQ